MNSSVADVATTVSSKRGTNAATTEASHIFRIDGLRALAVLAVLLFHLNPDWLSGGYVGVDVFFVVSGFLISRKIVTDLQTHEFSFRSFYLARIRRIFPALFVTLAITLVVGYITLPPLALFELSKETLGAVLSVSNFLFWKDANYFDLESTTKPLLHTWSLGVEEQYYLVLPLVLYMAMRAKGRNLVFPVMAVAFWVGLAASQLMISYDASGSFFLFPFRIFQFALGGLLALLFLNKGGGLSHVSSNRYLNESIPILATGLILFTCVFYTETTRFAGVNALWPSIGAAGIILADSSAVSRVAFENRIARFFGAISYSLYLVHWPVIVFWKYLRDDDSPTNLNLAFLALLSVAGGYLLFRFVETPFRSKREEGAYRVAPRPLVAAAFLVGGALAATSIVMISAGGSSSSSELDPEYSAILEIVGDPQQFHRNYYGGKDCVGPEGCETKPGSPVRSILAGDSHAGSLVFGVKEEYTSTNIEIVAVPGCPIFSADHWALGQADEAACGSGRDNVLRRARSSALETFVIHESWQKYMVEEFGGDREVRAQTIASEVTAFAEEAGAIQTIVIGGVPGSGSLRSPLDCLAQSGSDCFESPRTNEKIARRDDTNDLLEASLAAVNPALVFVDPFDVLCDDEYCQNFTPDGFPIYSDANHLSSWGSAYLVSELRERLRLED